MRKVAMLMLMLGVLIAVPARAALAFDDTEEKGCAETLLDCFYRAAAIDDWLRRWAAGIDCELDFIECARIKIRGH